MRVLLNHRGTEAQGFLVHVRLPDMLQHIIALVIFLFALHATGQTELRKVRNDAFSPGEYLRYKVYYDSWMTSWITAGYGIMEIDPALDNINGEAAYHIIVNGYSVGLFDLFFSVRDKFESFVDTSAMMPWKFIRYTREGGYKKDDTVYFDHVGKKAHSVRKDKDITPYVQDIVSAFYYMRTWDYDTAEAGDRYYLNFYLDDSLYQSEIIFLGRKKLKTDFGKINCMGFKPRVAMGEVFLEPYPMELWVTDDRNKIPVVMRSAVFIGSVKIELIDHYGLRWPLGKK